MLTRKNSIGWMAAMLAVGGFCSLGAASSQAAPASSVVVPGPVVSAPIVSTPAVHTAHGRIVTFTAAPNTPATITIEMRRRQDASSGSSFVMEKKTFPVAPNAPIQLITGSTAQPQTPDALTTGRRTALLVSDGVVNEIDVFARPAVDTTTYTNYYTPYRFYATNWLGMPYRYSRWYRGGWNRVGFTGFGNGGWSAGGSRHGVHHFASTHGAHVHHVGFKSGLSHGKVVGHKVAHHGKSVHFSKTGHAHKTGHVQKTGHHVGHVGHHGKTHHGHKASSHHAGHGKGHHKGHSVSHRHAGHHAHHAGHAHHRSGGHHRK
jgi:hypothetical protein